MQNEFITTYLLSIQDTVMNYFLRKMVTYDYHVKAQYDLHFILNPIKILFRWASSDSSPITDGRSITN